MNKKDINSLIIKSQYIKDLSFENPFSPNVVTLSSEPKVTFDIKLNLLPLNQDEHELTLIIKSEAKFQDEVVFLIELQYAGVFQYKISDDNDKKEFVIEGAKFLFPYARSIISNVTKDGGYNPLIIQPFDFKKIYKN